MSSLPVTGAGATQDAQTGILGAVTLGAAALLAAKKLRETPEATTEE